MSKIPIIKAKDFYKLLIKYGCIATSIKGSHHKLYNPRTNKTSIITIHSNKDVSNGAFLSALNQLAIEKDDFLNFMNK